MLRIVRARTTLEAGDPGIVHEHVEPPEPREDVRVHGLPRRLVANVEGKGEHAFTKPSRRNAEGWQVDVGGDDLRPLADEGGGDRLANATRRAGHVGDLPL